MDSRRRFVRSLLGVSAAFMVFFAVEFVVEWVNLGRPGLDAMSWAGRNNAKLVDLLSPMARAYNNILAMLLATIGLAIPLTANMHTPKLIDMFLRDRLNQLMLTLFAFGAAHVLWTAWIIGPDYAPPWAYRLSFFGAIVGWAALIPYFFYVVRFLDPSNILSRLKDQVCAEIDRAAAGRADLERSQDVIHERLHQIGTIVLKSLDRADRSVVLEGVWSLKQILDHYGAQKGAMPVGWFRVDRKDFVGLSAEAIEIVNEDRTWLEQKVMHQMLLAYTAALAKSTDAVSAVSDATRVIAGHAAGRADDKALALLVRYFNTYLREAIKRRDARAVYDLFYQYRVLGRELLDHPDLLGQIGRYFRFYSDLARAGGLEFIPQLAGFDLGWLARRAYEARSPAADRLLADVLALDHLPSGAPSPLLIKAKVLLGGFFVESSLDAEAARVRENLANAPAATVAALGGELLDVDTRTFWEITDRQVNLEWTQDERRPHVRAFLASLAAAPAAPPPGALAPGAAS